jgi:hypothetical protein
MRDDTETGLKWWMRYVIVPIIGGGGIIAIIVALIPTRTIGDDPNKHGSPKEPRKTQQEQQSPEAKDRQLFFASSKSSAHEEKQISIPAGDNVTLHWEVKNKLRGSLSI